MFSIQMMLQLIPDGIFVWITYAMLAAGLGAYVASKVLLWLPVINTYKLPVEILGVVVLVVGAYFYGGVSYREMIAEYKEKVRIAEQQSLEANEKLAEEVKKKAKVIKETVYVNREIIKEVTGGQIDATCRLPRSAVSVHDRASQNEVAGRAEGTDGTPSEVKASQLLTTVVENYGSCHDHAARLEAWQQWYRDQKRIWESIK
jgi:hypothetical protein